MDLWELIRSRNRGRPVYAWRIRDAQYAALAQRVRGCRWMAGSDSRNAADFCLYAAETLRREYRGGSWTWEVVTETLPTMPADKVQRDKICRELVEKGMRQLERPIQQTGRGSAFLASLVREAGLPDFLLSPEQSGGLRECLRYLIMQGERHGQACAEWAVYAVEKLPRMYRNDEIRELCAELADQIVALRRLGKACANDCTEAELAKLPIRLGEAAVDDLLAGLLRTPREPRMDEHNLCVVETYWAGGDLRREIVLARTLSEAAMGKLLGSSEVPARVVIWARVGTRAATRIAVAAKERNRYVLEDLDASLEGAGMVSVELRVSGAASKTYMPPGGEALDAEDLWVFEDSEDEPHTLLGVGAINVSSERVWVIAPTTMTLVAGETVAERTFETQCGRLMIGPSSWVDGCGNVVRVAFDSSDAARPTYWLVGRQKHDAYSNQMYWHGEPACYMRDIAGVVRKVAIVRRYQGRPNAWGAVQICVFDGQQVMWQTRAMVLPAAFRCRWGYGATSEVSASELRGAAVNDKPVGRAGDGAFRWENVGQTPQRVALRFDVGEFIATVTPLRERIGIECDAQDAEYVHAEKLWEYQAVAVTPQSCSQFVLRARRRDNRWTDLGRLVPSDDKMTHQLALRDAEQQLQDVFAMSDDVDEQVAVRVETYKGDSRCSKEVNVRRYAERPRFEIGAKTVSVSVGRSLLSELRNGAALEMQLRPLVEPANAVLMTVDGACSWATPLSELQTSKCWMLVGLIGGRLVTRPTMIYFEWESNAPGLLHELEQHDKPARRAYAVQLWRELAENWHDARWPAVLNFVAAMNKLPPATFDVIDMLADVPQAAVMCLFKLPEVSAATLFWERLPQTRFLWELVPWQAWQAAARMVPDEEAGRLAVWQLAKELEDDAPLLQLVLSVAYARNRELIPKPQYNLIEQAELLRGALRDRAIALEREHCNDRWPEVEDASEMSALKATMAEWHGDVPVNDSSFKNTVKYLPLLLARCAFENRTPEFENRYLVRKVRRFDQQWFSFAYAVALANLHASAHKVRKEEKHVQAVYKRTKRA